MGGADLSQILTGPDTAEVSYGGNFKPLKKNTSGMSESDSFSTVITARIASDVNDLKASVRRPNMPQGNNDQALSTAFDTKKSSQSSIRDIAVSKADAQRAAKLSSTNTSSAAKTDNVVTDKVTKALDDFKGGVKDIIKDALGVSDQDIENAMEELGLSFTDLSDPTALRDLLMMLTGTEDPSQLLSIDGVSAIKGGISDLVSTLLQDTGLDLETLKTIDTELNTAVFTDKGADIGLQAPVDEEAPLAQADAEENTVAQNTASTEDGIAVSNTVENDTASASTVTAQTAAAEETTVTRPDEKTATRTGNENAAELSGNERVAAPSDNMTANRSSDTEENAGSLLSGRDETEEEPDALLSAKTPDEEAESTETVTGNTSDSSDIRTGKTPEQARQIAPVAHEQAAAGHADIQNPLNAQANPATEQVQPATPYATQNFNTADIIRQMATGVRTALQGSLTSLEMQLNPENLGKMILRVTEQDGQVTAHINLQNENVKTAMESQMALIRQNLEAQGIKITEVTVTADAHEFERNLEEGQASNNFDLSNTDGNRQTDGDEDGNGRVRNLDMREFESGDVDVNDLSESERLQAQIMRENGNTLNLNA